MQCQWPWFSDVLPAVEEHFSITLSARTKITGKKNVNSQMLHCFSFHYYVVLSNSENMGSQVKLIDCS